MRQLLGQCSGRVGRASVLATALATATVIVALITPHLLGRRLGTAIAGLGNIRPVWVSLAGGAFLCSLLAMALAWRVALATCGARLSRRQVWARYGLGSLVNTIAPFRLGDAVRVALFARALERRDKIWTVGGALGAIEVARICCIAVLVAVAAALGALPLWPALGLAALVAAAILLALVAPRHRRLCTKVANLLTATRELLHSPARAVGLLGFVAAATVSRVLAAISVCAALHIRSPLVAGLLIVAALDLGGQIPLTPGNFGVASGTVAVALTSRGIGLDAALTAGIALQAVETAAGISFGAVGALLLAEISPSVLRRWSPVLVGALAGAVGITVTSLSIFTDLT